MSQLHTFQVEDDDDGDVGNEQSSNSVSEGTNTSLGDDVSSVSSEDGAHHNYSLDEDKVMSTVTAQSTSIGVMGDGIDSPLTTDSAEIKGLGNKTDLCLLKDSAKAPPPPSF